MKCWRAKFLSAAKPLSLIYLKRGQHKEALTAAQKAVELSERSGIYLSTLGFVYAQTGNSKEALTLVKELEEKFSRQEANGHHVAAIFAGLGDKDSAFVWLEKDFRNRSSTLVAWINFTTFESLRGDPRMADLRRRMGLPQ